MRTPIVSFLCVPSFVSNHAIGHCLLTWLEEYKVDSTPPVNPGSSLVPLSLSGVI